MLRSTFLRRYEKVLNTRPLVVATLTGGPGFDASLSRICRSRADIVEVRLDTFPAVALPSSLSLAFAGDLVRYVKKRSRRPVLVTCRWPREAGPMGRLPFVRSEQRRCEILKSVLPMADLIDLEIRNRASTKKLTSLSRRAGVSVVHSFHQFTGLTRPGPVKKLATLSRRWGGEFFKVATAVPNEEQLEYFLKWGSALPHPRFILIGMGKVGEPSRVLGFSFGSRLTYGHAGKSAAPGQLPVEKLASAVHVIYAGARR